MPKPTSEISIDWNMDVYDGDEQWYSPEEIKAAIGKITRLRGIDINCRIHNAIASEKEMILKKLNLE